MFTSIFTQGLVLYRSEVFRNLLLNCLYYLTLAVSISDDAGLDGIYIFNVSEGETERNLMKNYFTLYCKSEWCTRRRCVVIALFILNN